MSAQTYYSAHKKYTRTDRKGAQKNQRGALLASLSHPNDKRPDAPSADNAPLLALNGLAMKR
jgi:hypothetical protein